MNRNYQSDLDDDEPQDIPWPEQFGWIRGVVIFAGALIGGLVVMGSLVQ